MQSIEKSSMYRLDEDLKIHFFSISSKYIRKQIEKLRNDQIWLEISMDLLV